MAGVLLLAESTVTRSADNLAPLATVASRAVPIATFLSNTHTSRGTVAELDSLSDFLFALRANVDILSIVLGCVLALVSLIRKLRVDGKGEFETHQRSPAWAVFALGALLAVFGTTYNIVLEREKAAARTIDFRKLGRGFEVEEGGNYVVADGSRQFLIKCPAVHYHADTIDLEFQTLGPGYEKHVLTGIKDNAAFTVQISGRDYIGGVESVANARNSPDIAFINMRHAR